MKTLKILSGILIMTLFFYSCDKNEFAPEIVDQEFTLEENSEAGTLLGNVDASDADEGQSLGYELVDGNEEGVFEIDQGNGLLSVSDPANLDYETNPQFVLTVVVTDSHEKEPLESSAKISINVTDVNEYAPVMNQQIFSIDENPLTGSEIGVIQAIDQESHQKLYYSIVGLNDNNYFQIDSLTGTLAVMDSSGFDFETNQQLTVLIQVTDDHFNAMTDTATITVNVQDVLEITDGLIAHFPFNGNAVDESRNNIPATVESPVLTDDRFGNTEGAYLFNGISDKISLNNNSPLITSNVFTISLWARINGESLASLKSNTLFEQRDDGSGSPTVIHFNAQQDGQIVLNMRSDVSVANYAIRCDYAYDNDWHHYVARVDDQRNMEIYIDGELYCSGTFPDNGAFTNSIDHVKLGSHHPDGVQRGAFNGSMDEILFHNRALKKVEIEALYSGQLLEER